MSHFSIYWYKILCSSTTGGTDTIIMQDTNMSLEIIMYFQLEKAFDFLFPDCCDKQLDV